MSVFSAIFFKIISILLSVVMGFVAGRTEKVERESIASLIFYFVAPIVFFSIPASSNITVSDLGIVIVAFIISCTSALITYKIATRFWDEQTRNLLAMSAGSGNVGYFMLPVASILFDSYTLSIYMLAVVGINIYESSLGYYLCARSISSTKESVMKVLKLPMLHAFMVGCFCSLMGLTLPGFLNDFIISMKTTYSVLGMMMVGLGLSKLKSVEIDVKFTLSMFASKYILVPILVFCFIVFDKFILRTYGIPEYNALVLISSAPLAANTIVLSSLMKFNPERAATSVLISCIFSLVFIPLIALVAIS
jgi:malate permease and related proteins